MHALAHHRRRLGLAATVVGLGPVIGAGMLERNKAVAKILQARGADFVTVDEVVEVLARVAAMRARDLPHDFFFGRIGAMIHDPSLQTPPPTTALSSSAATTTTLPALAANIKWSHLVRPRAASDKPQTAAQSKALLLEKISQVLGLDVSGIDPDTALVDMGLDSLTSTEIVSFARRALGLEVLLSDLLMGMTLRSMLEALDVLYSVS